MCSLLNKLDAEAGAMIGRIESNGWVRSKRGNTWSHPTKGRYVRLVEAYQLETKRKA